MAFGEFKMFQFKSRQQREREEREYAAWAFPHGDLQKENLTKLMSEIRPKESSKMLLFSFLSCKEIYKEKLEVSGSREEAIEKFLDSAKNYRQLFKKTDLTMYLALVLADAETDERCEYPPADEIRARILELEESRKSK